MSTFIFVSAVQKTLDYPRTWLEGHITATVYACYIYILNGDSFSVLHANLLQ